MPRADRLQTLLWAGLLLALLVLFYVLRPILTPFLMAGIFAYICVPLVDVLERRHLPRVLGVVLVILCLITSLIALILILLPLVREETAQMIERLPQLVALWNEQWLPWLDSRLGLELRSRLDPASLRQLIMDNWDSAQTLLQSLLQSLKIGGLALVGWITTLMLVPVVMFYLLLDWHSLRARIRRYIPRLWFARIHRLARESDAVLAEFLRGQSAVMLSLSLYYSVGLWLAGVDFALPLGVITGLLIFIPYVGFALGLTLALLVALLQFAGFAPLVGVAVVYGCGQLLESFLLTPFLVGQRIGLHPLAVIFALLAFGQLFGFFGVLLALPASAVLLVALRELSNSYLSSRFYRGEEIPT